MRQPLKIGRHSLLLRWLSTWLTLSLATTAFANGGGTGRYLWKSIPAAQIKIDDKTPLAWNIFQTGQKKEANLVLVLLGCGLVELGLATGLGGRLGCGPAPDARGSLLPAPAR